MDDLHAILEVLENADIPEGQYIRMTKTLKDLYTNLPKINEPPPVRTIPYGSLFIGHSVPEFPTPADEIRLMEANLEDLRNTVREAHIELEYSQSRIRAYQNVDEETGRILNTLDEYDDLLIKENEYNIKRLEMKVARLRLTIVKIENGLVVSRQQIQARAAS
jgi:hypothetical protein